MHCADFRSRNCLREVHATLEQNKPLVLVIEEDTDHGGQSIEASKAECPTDARGGVFGPPTAERPLVPWMRLPAFRNETFRCVGHAIAFAPALKGTLALLCGCCVSAQHSSCLAIDVELFLPFTSPPLVADSPCSPCRLIATQMLAVSPAFQGVGGPVLHFHVEVRLKHLAFAKHVTLLYSGRNRGAHAAAEELCGHVGNVKQAPFDLATHGRALARRPHRWSMSSKYLSPLGAPQDVPPPMQSGKGTTAGGVAGVAKLVPGIAQLLCRRRTGAKRDQPTSMFLLYLNEDVFTDEDSSGLARDVIGAMDAAVPLVLIHENDTARKGCEFARFFSVTPPELLERGIFRDLANAWFFETYREIGIKLTAQRMGALQSTQKQGQKALQASARSSDTVPKYGAASDGSLGGVRV